MNVTRYWTDGDGRPHAEVTEWQANPAGEPLSVAPPAFITNALEPGTLVILVTVAEPVVDLSSYANVTGYLELPLRAGATVVDEEDYRAAQEAELAAAQSIDDQIAEYLASTVPEDAGTLVDKLAAHSGLTPGEKSVLAARLT